MWHELGLALALLLVLEGIFPFLNPAAFKRAQASLMQLDDKSLRVGGLASMLIGLALLYLIKN